MNKDRYDRVFLKANEEEQEQLEFWWDACVELREKYKTDRSASVVKNLQAAEDALERAASPLEDKYFSSAPTFRNLLAAWEWLKDQGYKISRSKWYEDAGEDKITVQHDKSVRESDVMSYILKEGIERETDGKGNYEARAEEKAKLEIDFRKKQKEKLEWELDREKGKFLLKSDVRVEFALKIAGLEAALKHLFRTRLVDWLIMAGGKAKKAPMVLDLIYGEMDGLLNEMGNMEEVEIFIRKSDPPEIKSAEGE